MTTTANATRVADWIRPWYPGGHVGHLSPNCLELLQVEPEPREGAGWLDLRTNDTCRACLDQHGYASWHAECKTCGTCLCDDFTSQPYISEADAKRWKEEHECEPVVALQAPPKPNAPPQQAGQLALIPLTALAVEAAR